MALPKISTIKILTKRLELAASAIAAPEPTTPTQSPQRRLTVPTVSPEPKITCAPRLLLIKDFSSELYIS